MNKKLFIWASILKRRKVTWQRRSITKAYKNDSKLFEKNYSHTSIN
jgi:hypothetical protein